MLNKNHYDFEWTQTNRPGQTYRPISDATHATGSWRIKICKLHLFKCVSKYGKELSIDVPILRIYTIVFHLKAKNYLCTASGSIQNQNDLVIVQLSTKLKIHMT